MSLHIDLDAPSLAQAIGNPRGQQCPLVPRESIDTMPDPYATALAEASREWRWLPVALLAAAGVGLVASYLWPWGVL